MVIFVKFYGRHSQFSHTIKVEYFFLFAGKFYWVVKLKINFQLLLLNLCFASKACVVYKTMSRRMRKPHIKHLQIGYGVFVKLVGSMHYGLTFKRVVSIPLGVQL